MMSEIEQIWERNARNRVRAEERHMDAQDAKLAQCEYLIGQLNSGAHYIITRAGKVKNFADWWSAANFLIRNRYVTSRKNSIPESQEIR